MNMYETSTESRLSDIKSILYRIEEKLEEPVEDNETKFVVKECPRCHYRIEGLSDEKTDKLIEEKFGYRQMDPNNPLDRKPQSYCRNCRNILQHSDNEKPADDHDDVTEIELFGNSYVVDDNKCVKSPKGNLVKILTPRIRINGRSDRNVTKHQFSLLKQPQIKSTLSHQEPS